MSDYNKIANLEEGQERLVSLVKELADSLESAISLVNGDSCLDCKYHSKCNAKEYPHACIAQARFGNLVAKAREMVNLREAKGFPSLKATDGVTR